MNGTVSIRLPTGLWLNDICHREAVLRPLTGRDEALLLELDPLLPLAQRTTLFLTCCLSRLGTLAPVTSDFVRALTVGDREALLLHLRRLTLGDRMQCVLNCPNPECGEKMDLDLKVSDLLLPAYAHSQAVHHATLQDQNGVYQVTFRLPTGGDQETVAGFADAEPQVAVDRLLHQCVEQVTCQNNPEEPLIEDPEAIAQQLPAILSELDPQAELVLNLACPVCGQPFSTLLDTAMHFFQELTSQIKTLDWEVHWLALHYHWSESEILGLTRHKRRRYLNLLEDTLSNRRSE